MKKKYRVVGFLAREHGLNGLMHLTDSDNYKPVCVFTHRFKPKSQDIGKGQRKDFTKYKSLCAEHSVPLYAIDTRKESLKIYDILEKIREFDFIVSISWRRLIPENQLDMPEIGGINLHRGKLPDYPGAEPIKQALSNRDDFIYITSHILAKEIDSGDTIALYKHPVNYNDNHSLNKNIERLKKELTPHFGPLLIKSLNIMAYEYETR